jgi:ADP-heptose:LPS heptosyltransferase
MKLYNDIHKIAVLRANALGDFVFSLPALAALRAAYPYAEIVLLGQPWHAEFLAGRPGPVDRVIVIPRSQGVREDRGAPGTYADAEAMERFFAAMQHEHFDLAVQLHGGGRHSNPFTLRLGARISVGLRTPDAQPLDRWVPYIYFQPEILRCLEVVSLAGAPRLDLEPHLAVTQADLDESCDVVAAAPGTESAPLVVLHPGAGDGRRQWPPEKFAAVGDSLAEAGARIVISGTDPERSLVRAVCTTMLGAAQDACGALSLGGLTGLLSRCSLVVANDSGPLHLAEATGAATVGIYWCGNLINAEPITRTRHRPHLSWRLDCPVCGRNCIDDNCDHHASFVADVPVDEVTASALSLLAAPHRPGQAQGQADSVSFGADWGHDGQPKGDRRDP